MGVEIPDGMTAPAHWNMASAYRVVRDGEQEVLEHIDKTDRCLIAGEPLLKQFDFEYFMIKLNVCANARKVHNV